MSNSEAAPVSRDMNMERRAQLHDDSEVVIRCLTGFGD